MRISTIQMSSNSHQVKHICFQKLPFFTRTYYKTDTLPASISSIHIFH